MRVSKEFKVGLLVVLGFLLIYVLVNILKGESIWGGDREFLAEFDNSFGLAPSNAVLLNGVKVGQVVEVDLHPEKVDKVQVRFSIQDDELQISDSSVIWLVSSDILGTKALEIKLDTVPRKTVKYYQEGDVFVSRSEQTIEEQINEQILPLKKKTEELLVSIDGIILSVKTFWDTSAAYTIDESLYEVRDAIDKFGELANNLSVLVQKETEQVSKILKDVKQISGTLADKTQLIAQTLDNLHAITDTIKNSNLGIVIDEAEVALSEFSDLLAKINSGEGSMGKLLHTSVLHDELEKTMVALQNVLNDLEANPNKYVHFSLFGRKTKGYTTTPEKEDILDEMLDSLQLNQ